MSEDTTQNMPSRPFEDRVFARFDSLEGHFDSRFDLLDGRIGTLESQAQRRALETKPIWERALAEIGEVKIELGEVKIELCEVKIELGEVKVELGEVKGELGEVKVRLGAVENRLGGVEDRQGAVEDRLAALENLSRPILRKVDALTKDVMTVRSEQMGLEDRIEKLDPTNI